MILLTTPLPGRGLCGPGSVFGACRPVGSNPCGRKHAGNDLCAPFGEKIRAPHYGKVIFAGERNATAGHGVITEMQDPLTKERYEFRGYHVNPEIPVKVGDTVVRGQVLALVSDTGNANGPHLHYEIRKGGTWGVATDAAQPLDPYPIVTPVIKVGATHPYVKFCRGALLGLGYTVTVGPGELYDPGLEVFIRQFQSNNGLVVDGKIGPSTLYRLGQVA